MPPIGRSKKVNFCTMKNPRPVGLSVPHLALLSAVKTWKWLWGSLTLSCLPFVLARELGLFFWVLLSQFKMQWQEGVFEVSGRTNSGKPTARQPPYNRVKPLSVTDPQWHQVPALCPRILTSTCRPLLNGFLSTPPIIKFSAALFLICIFCGWVNLLTSVLFFCYRFCARVTVLVSTTSLSTLVPYCPLMDTAALTAVWKSQTMLICDHLLSFSNCALDEGWGRNS